jgi:hypothetical protein
MKLNLLKCFAAVAMLCMVGAVFATPVALGDIWIASAYYLSKNSPNWSPEAGLSWSLTGLYLGTVYRTAIGMAFGGPAGAAAGLAISL